MGASSQIEWTDSTWNPVRGCTKISPGCKNCYAETFAERFRGVPGHPYEQGFDLRLVPTKLLEPLTWAQPRKVFVNSMSDLFHESIPDDYIRSVAEIMKLSNWHLYQILTKRAERMREMLNTRLRDVASEKHIWWGVSVENRKYGLPRLEHLRASRAGVRFLSVEPLIEDLGEVDLSGVDWVIVGGESGNGARPLERCWVEGIREQCRQAEIPFFFKQWGGIQKKRHGRLLNGQTYDEFPEIATAPILKRSQRLKLLREWTPMAKKWETLAEPVRDETIKKTKTG